MTPSPSYQHFHEWLVAYDFHVRQAGSFTISESHNPGLERLPLGSGMSAYLNEFEEDSDDGWAWFTPAMTPELASGRQNVFHLSVNRKRPSPEKAARMVADSALKWPLGLSHAPAE